MSSSSSCCLGRMHLRILTITSANVTARCMSWLTMMALEPWCSLSFWVRISITRTAFSASRLPVGSSPKSTVKSGTMARAKAKRCCWPPESSCDMRFSSTCSSPRSARTFLVRWKHEKREKPCSILVNAIFSNAVKLRMRFVLFA